MLEFRQEQGVEGNPCSHFMELLLPYFLLIFIYVICFVAVAYGPYIFISQYYVGCDF
jgi:hypothetical protein